MQQTRFRFFAELNDLLPPLRGEPELAYQFGASPSVKDAIEAFGVPHADPRTLTCFHISWKWIFGLEIFHRCNDLKRLYHWAIPAFICSESVTGSLFYDVVVYWRNLP